MAGNAMRLKLLLAIVAIAGAGCGAVTTYFAIRPAATGTMDMDTIIFPMKVFTDGGPDGDFVNVEGTLTGEGIGYPNNTTEIVCYRSDMRCITASVDQLSPRQVGSMGPPLELAVTNWSASVVTAVGPSEGTCARLTINIDRRAEGVEWVQEPINQSQLFCKNASTKTYKWSIENPPFWQRMKERARP
jgi:hypothetical protein